VIAKALLASAPLVLTASLYAQQNLPIVTKVVNTAGGNPIIAPNTWIEIHGANLAPATMDWSGWNFANGLPTSLDGVSVTVDNKPAVISYISPTQINVLAPLDTAVGPVPVQVTTAAGESTPVAPTEEPTSPGFLVIDTAGHVAARHMDYSLLGDVSLSIPGYPFTPARPGETVLLYATGFGQTNPPIVDQTSTTGSLPALPAITIGGLPAFVMYAGVSAPGLYQLNVAIPLAAPDGDLTLSAIYNGNRTQSGVALAVQH
jgi:uncharacterized protein (TIGR03437 family)